jgi:hypothetical protein
MAAPYVQIWATVLVPQPLPHHSLVPVELVQITVTNGGSGYLPLNFGGTEEQAVTVLITTGYVTNIFYR